MGQHVHVVQPIRRINGKVVVFGEGNLISNQFLMAQDWPFGAALTTLLLIGLVFGLMAYRRWEPEA